LVAAFVLAAWISYILSLFDQVSFESPIGKRKLIFKLICINLDLLTTDQFLLFLTVLITVIFALLIRIYFPLYAEYRTIKKLNDRRRMERDFDNESQEYMGLNFTARPTSL
jgi:hypothetical protein